MRIDKKVKAGHSPSCCWTESAKRRFGMMCSRASCVRLSTACDKSTCTKGIHERFKSFNNSAASGRRADFSAAAATTEPATTQIAATQIATTIPSDELLENTVVDGFNMSDDDARSLEKTVHENPVDIVGRAKLLGYYYTRPFNSAESQAARAASPYG